MVLQGSENEEQCPKYRGRGGGGGKEAMLGWEGGEHVTLLCGFTCYRVEAILDL